MQIKDRSPKPEVVSGLASPSCPKASERLSESATTMW